jgi:hypothetical protein
MRASLLPLAAAPALALALAAAPAQALGPLEIELAGKVGGASNGYGFGAGGRAGLAIFGLYGGFNVVDYPSPSVSLGSILTYGGEVGYGFKISVIAIRPLLGFGKWTIAEVSTTQAYVAGTSSFYVQPGGVLEVELGHFLFGVDASALIPSQYTSYSAFAVDGELGVRF